MTGALYIYGILPAHAVHGVAANSAVCGTGLSGAPVTCLPVDGFAALVSDTEGAPVARTRRNLIAHTSVLERALTLGTVLPLRFGTIVPDALHLAGCLAANRAPFIAALADIDGCVELGVKAIWRKGLVFADIVERDTGLRGLRDRLRSRPAGETYYERIELGRRVEAALAERRVTEAERILADLQPLAVRETELRMTDDDMIFHRAFLVRRAHETAFDAVMERLAGQLSDRVEFRYVGPVPAFNFVSLQTSFLAPPVGTTTGALAGAA
jgi:hypothetical protein